MRILGILFIGYYGIQLLDVWLCWVGARFFRTPAVPPDPKDSDHLPIVYVVTPCREAPDGIRGLVACLKKQDYPAARYRILLLIDSDDESDPSRELARSLGVQVYLRCRGPIRTKGDALNELFQQRLQYEAFDAAVFLDVDSRVGPHFLTRVAAYVQQGTPVLQGTMMGKNPDATVMARLGAASLALVQLHYLGRAAWGGLVQLGGTGMVLTRDSLVRLGWQFGKGRHLTEDVELNLRCILQGLPVRYAPDLEISVDVPEHSRLMQRQRRRWDAGFIELIVPYFWPLLRKSLQGDGHALQALFFIVLGPPFSVLFLFTGVLALFLNGCRFAVPSLAVWGNWIAALWVIHGLFYGIALRDVGLVLGWEELRGIVAFMNTRILAILQGAALACNVRSVNRWEPMPHKDKDDPKK